LTSSQLQKKASHPIHFTDMWKTLTWPPHLTKRGIFAPIKLI